MTRQLDEISGGENATIASSISDLKEKGYTIKEVTGGENSITGISLSEENVTMERNTEKTVTYTLVYLEETLIRYFVEVDGKDYEIIFNNREIKVNTEETNLEGMNKETEVTVTSSDSTIIEANKTEDGKIVLKAKDKVGTVTITVKCGNQNQTCTVTVELFIGLDKSETNPEGALPSGDIEIIESDASKGIVIKDKNDREWVWVEVPKTIFTTATSSTDYTKIKADLITYAGVYRKGSASQNYNWTDEWYNGCGIADSGTYTTYYNKMLKSVYENGGFWIQRYEDGTTRITCTNAQIKASGFAPDSTKTSSLLFGIQWDLVCKYLEVKGGLTIEQINSDSSSWGRYSSNSALAGLARNEKMNIYDFAGNLWEWTLEHATESSNWPSVYRSGQYPASGSSYPASYRYARASNYTENSYISFRATFY